MGSLPETYNDPNASVHKTKQRHSKGEEKGSEIIYS